MKIFNELYDYVKSANIFNENINQMFNIKKSSEYIKLEKNRLLNELFISIGFKDGIFTKEPIKNLINFDISDDKIKQIRYLFKNDGDIGQFRAKKEPHKLYLWMARLAENFYGLNCSCESILSYIDGKRARINKNYQIKLNDVN